MASAARRVASHAAVLAAFAAVSVAYVLPAIGGRLGGLGPDLGDPLLNLYFLEWGKHQIDVGFSQPWSPPFFFPTPRVLALSDHLFGPATVFWTLRRGGLSPAVAYNVLLLATFALCGWSAWFVLRQGGRSNAAALCGAWFFAFAGYRWSAVGHYQVLRMQWIPLVLWTFDRLLERASVGRAAAFLLAYALHVAGGAYLAVLVHVALAVLLANRLGRWRWPAERSTVASWALTLLGMAAILAPLYGPYLESPVPLATRQPFLAVRENAATIASYLCPSRHSLEGRLVAVLPAEAGRGALFPGVAALVFVVAGLASGLRRVASTLTRAQWAGCGVGAIAAAIGLVRADGITESAPPEVGPEAYLTALLLVLAGAALALLCSRTAVAEAWRRTSPWPRGLLLAAVGLSLLCLPVFFAFAWNASPGLRALRVPTRAFAIALFPLAALVALGAERLLTAARRRRVLWGAAAALLVLLVVEGWPVLPPWQRLPPPGEFPDYAKWIAVNEEVAAYLELPLGKLPPWETGPMYLQTLHWRPLANGYSAVLPPSFQEISLLCRPFPDADGLARIRRLGVSHVVVHRRTLDWMPGPETRARVARRLPFFEQTLAEAGAVRVFSSRGATDVYRLARPARGDAGR